MVFGFSDSYGGTLGRPGCFASEVYKRLLGNWPVALIVVVTLRPEIGRCADSRG